MNDEVSQDQINEIQVSKNHTREFQTVFQDETDVILSETVEEIRDQKSEKIDEICQDLHKFSEEVSEIEKETVEIEEDSIFDNPAFDIDEVSLKMDSAQISDLSEIKPIAEPVAPPRTSIPRFRYNLYRLNYNEYFI
jgi:hypothetical protein